MTMRSRFAIFVLWIGALCASPVPAAEPSAGEVRPTPEERVQQAIRDALLSQPLLMVVGNGVAWHGDPVLLATDWLGLACTAQCALRPARLTINPPTEESGGVPVLHFTVDEGDAASVHAWLAVDPEREWLRAGPVVQYPFAGRRDTPGTFEQAIETSTAGGAQLVPVIDGLPAPVAPWEDAVLVVYLQLREAGRRQLLPGHLAVCADVPLADYLRWAGDLDRDGRADYLVHLGDNGGEFNLYLSSQATDGSLVGRAARAMASPGDAPECEY
jgi:hypothetical protein